jgi:hypothetical protein
MLDQQFYPSSRDAVTQEVHTGPAERAFLAVESKTILRKPLQNLLQMKEIGLLVTACNQDII